MAQRTGNWQLCAAALGLALAASPARADTFPEIEALSRATASPASGVALARRQIGDGDLLGALATLERVLILFPAAQDAQLLHAGLLCRLDDRSGATIGFDRLRRRGIPDAVWNEANAPCAASARSGARP